MHSFHCISFSLILIICRQRGKCLSSRQNLRIDTILDNVTDPAKETVISNNYYYGYTQEMVDNFQSSAANPDEETGIVFSAPESYVKNMVRRLTTCYGVSLIPIINELK